MSTLALPGRQAELARLVRYGVVGGINTLVSFAGYSVLVLAAATPYWAANAAGTGLSVLVGYGLSSRFVFRAAPRARDAGRYAATIGAQLAFSTLLIGVLLRVGVGEVAAWVLVLPPAVGLSFALQRCWVFGGTS